MPRNKGDRVKTTLAVNSGSVPQTFETHLCHVIKFRDDVDRFHETIIEILTRFGYEYDKSSHQWFVRKKDLSTAGAMACKWEIHTFVAMFVTSVMLPSKDRPECEIPPVMTDAELSQMAREVPGIHRASTTADGIKILVNEYDKLRHRNVKLQNEMEAISMHRESSEALGMGTVTGRMVTSKPNSQFAYAHKAFAEGGARERQMHRRNEVLQADNIALLKKVEFLEGHVEMLKSEQQLRGAAAKAEPVQRGPIIYCQNDED